MEHANGSQEKWCCPPNAIKSDGQNIQHDISCRLEVLSPASPAAWYGSLLQVEKHHVSPKPSGRAIGEVLIVIIIFSEPFELVAPTEQLDAGLLCLCPPVLVQLEDPELPCVSVGHSNMPCSSHKRNVLAIELSHLSDVLS